jgi:hypothetical protein
MKIYGAEKPKQFQGSGFKPKGSFVKKGAPFKGSQTKGTMELLRKKERQGET